MPFRRPARRRAIVVTARNLDLAGAEKMAADGVAVITVPENRWERVDIKSVSLLPNVLAKQAAREQGAREAWFVDRRGPRHRRLVVQCLDRDPRRQGGHPPGRSRASCAASPGPSLLEAIAAQGLKLEERAFTLDEAYAAREAFITSASQIVLPVVQNRRPAGRQRRAGPDRVGAAARLSPLRRNLMSVHSIWHKRECSKSTRFCAVTPRTWACT